MLKGYKYVYPEHISGNVSKMFWHGLNKRKFLYQKCDDCNRAIFYPRVVCPDCLSDHLTWKESSGKGKIYSYTIVHRTHLEGFKEDVPYAVALIELDEGIRTMGNIIGWDNSESVKIGANVSIDYYQLEEDATVPIFSIDKEDM